MRIILIIFKVILQLGLKGSYRNKYHNPHLSVNLYSFVKKKKSQNSKITWVP